MRRHHSCAMTMLALLTAAVAAPHTAAAATAATPITGKLDVPGMTVIAVAPDGTTTSAKSTAAGRFSVASPGKTATLHLRSKAGAYAGPIVIERLSRSAAVMGVTAGTKLGSVDVRKGWALVEHAPADKRQARGLMARLAAGVPLGAAKLGLVKVSKGKVAAGLTKAGQDADRDGIINAFDVDDDGDLHLDNVDASSRSGGKGSAAPSSAKSARALPTAEERKVTIFSNLKLGLEGSLNANAGVGSMTKDAVNTALTSAQTLAIKVVPGDEVELDCGGLTYCATGGTGTALEASASGGTSFPLDFDADADGFGTIESGPTGDFQLLTGATFDKIGAGDTFIERVTAGSRSLQAPGILNYTFTSVPAVTSWSDGTTTTAVTYPVAPGSAGTAATPAGVTADASGDVVLTFTVWRPQRPRIAPIEARWVDIGELDYSVDVPNAPSGGGTAPGLCDASTLSESDASLTPSGNALHDLASDRAADASNTLTFTVNMTHCLGSGASWDVGETLNFDIQARTRDSDNAAQKLNFLRTA